MVSKLLIKCINIDSLNTYNFHVIIYDDNNNKVFDQITTNKPLYFFNKKGTYRIVIISPLNTYPSIFYSSFILNSNIDKLVYVFSKLSIIRLIDLNYLNLPIKNGEVILWPNLIQ